MKKMHIVLLVTVLIIPIFVSHVYAQTLYVDSRIGDMDKIDESKYRATGVSILRNSDGELISVARVDATRYLDDPIVDKFLKSNPDFLIKQGTVNGERVSLHEIEANYLYPECLEEVFDVIGYKNECAWYHRAYVTSLGINRDDERFEIFRGLNHSYTVKPSDSVTSFWTIIRSN